MQGYDMFMAPMEFLWFNDYRRMLLRDVSGKVLEIGIGTGANIQHYNYDNVDKVIGIDLNIQIPLLKKMNEKVFVYKTNTDVIPFEENSFDSVVITFVLCSIENQEEYLNEIKRVLKPDGKIYFLEHIMPCKEDIKIIDKLNACWNKMTNCNLNKRTDNILKKCFKKGRIVKVLKNVVCMGILINEK